MALCVITISVEVLSSLFCLLRGTMSQDVREFSRIRSALFPIHNWELPKYIPMSIMIFCTLFGFNLLRNMKDVLVVNAPASGAESLVFLKTFIVVPLTIVTTVLYLGMRKNKTFEQTFNRIIGSFFVFFLFFMIVYPYTSGGSGANYLHMSKDGIEALQARYPAMAHLFPLIGNWTFSLFYAASELWGTFVLSILFWQFANDIIGTADSKRFYPLMILSGNVGVLSIGLILFQISSQQGDFANTVYFTCITVLVLCCIIMGAFTGCRSEF